MRLLVIALATLMLTPHAFGVEVPEWVRELARKPLPASASGRKAIVLLKEDALTVRDNGEFYERTRRVVKVLQNSGRSEATLQVWSDKDTKILSMKGWCITGDGKEYAVKEKDALERTPFSFELYQDDRYKELTLAGAEVGSVVAFEYEQKLRPYARQRTWWFQEDIPVARSVFQLNLAPGWEFNMRSVNWPELKPIVSGASSWMFEVSDVPGVVPEKQMPDMRSVIGRLNISLCAANVPMPGMQMSSWDNVSAWADNLNAPQRQSSAAMKAKLAELVATQPSMLDRIRAVSSFVQREIRYVAIEIGIGGFQSHAAESTFAKKYGDCKDKSTLLATMLQELGVTSHMLLVHTERGVVNPAAPSIIFNHAILAIELPKEVQAPADYPTLVHPKFGRLVIFDPTDEYTPFGRLYPSLQNSYGLLVASNAGDLIRIPSLSPSATLLKRTGKFQLLPDGTLTGDMEEVRTGYEAWKMRTTLIHSESHKSATVLERMLAAHLGHARLESASIDNLEKHDEPLVLRYRFSAPNYASASGDLLFLKLQVVGTKSNPIAEEKDRRYPIIFTDSSALQTDDFEIKLPPGFVLDEAPRPVNAESPFATYTSNIESKENALRYSRSYTVKDVFVPLDKIGDLRALMRAVSTDERMLAILKKTTTTN